MRAPSESLPADALPRRAMATPGHAWAETAFITLLLPAIGWVWSTQDPFFLQARVPWVVIAPLLVGLHHGFACALTSALCLLGGALVCWRTGYTPVSSLPIDYAVILCLLGPLTGEYRDTWLRALRRFRRDGTEQRAQLERITRAYHLLKRSHDLLEQRVASGGPSLQAVLERVQDHLRRSDEPDLAGASDAILRVFGDYGQVQVASLHLVDAGEVQGAPMAQLGKAPPLDPGHPMVRDALAAGTLTSVREERLAACERGPLACVPLVDVDGQVWAIVIVHEMPFMAMHEEQLALLAVIGGRVGDWLAERAQVQRLPAHLCVVPPLVEEKRVCSAGVR